MIFILYTKHHLRPQQVATTRVFMPIRTLPS
jgi:hypothetical protein